jgi:hypothetical protein
VDIKSLAIIRSVYAAEMVVGGGNYLVVSAKGLAMKEVNPSQIGKAMMGTWKKIKEELTATILISAIEISEPVVTSYGKEPEDTKMDPELFADYVPSTSDSTEPDEQGPDLPVSPNPFTNHMASTSDSPRHGDPEASILTPDSSDQGSEGDNGAID